MSKLNIAIFSAGNVAARRPVRILQFGEGNFLRAFATWMVQVLNDKRLFDGSILAVNNTRRGSVETLKAQDCLYTVLTRGLKDGRKVDERQLVSSISRALNPYAEWSAFVEAAKSPELGFVISNTTEAGIVYKAQPFAPGECPESFPAKCAARLAARAEAFSNDVSKGGLLFLPCELIERNGGALRDAILKHLSDWNMASAAKWVEASCVFANTLVDRIVPGRPSPEESAAIFAELGYEDSMMVAAEPFHFFAIEAPEKVWDALPLRKAGLNVVWAKDIQPYRTRKVRMLNATHTANVLGAFLGGIDTVREMMEHPSFGRLARKSLYEELLPTVPLPEAESKAFADSVVERFLNPFIRHELISISLNSVSKWKVRVLPALLDTVKSGKGLPPCLAFSLAALAVFYRGPLSAAGDSIQGSRHMVKDDPQALKAFVSAWRAGDVAKLADAILPDASLWGVDLTSVQGLRERFVRDVENILELGAEKAARIAGGL